MGSFLPLHTDRLPVSISACSEGHKISLIASVINGGITGQTHGDVNTPGVIRAWPR